jgi:hypothetical protein
MKYDGQLERTLFQLVDDVMQCHWPGRYSAVRAAREHEDTGVNTHTSAVSWDVSYRSSDSDPTGGA